MNVLRRASIRTRLVLLILATVTIVVGAALAAWVHRDVHALAEHARADLRALLTAQNFDFVRLIVFRSPEAAADTVSRLQKFDVISTLVVYDLKDNIVIAYQKPGSNPAGRVPAGDGHEQFLEMHHDVTYDDQKYGTVFVRAESNAFGDELPAVMDTFKTLIPILLVLTLGLAVLFQRYFSAPVLRLTHFIRNIADTKDYNLRIPVFDAAEFGVLYNGFNEMLARIAAANTELTKEKERLNRILESISDVVLLTDANMNVTYANQAARRLLAIATSDQTVHPRPLTEYLTITDANGLTVNPRGLQSHNSAAFGVLVLKSEQSLFCDVSVTALNDSNNNRVGAVVAIHDITDRRNAEALAHRAEQEKIAADAANQAKSAFLAHMSHEIRTPLTAIIGHTENLHDDDMTATQRQQTVDTLLRSSRHLLQIINDILDFSKIESGKLSSDRSATAVSAIMHEVTDIIDGLSRQKGLDFSIQFDTPIPAEIHSDGLRVKQILMNLLSNAVKFTDRGRVELRLSCDKEQQRMRFSVRDSGIGMTTEQLAIVFDPFVQADNSISRRYGGTGLGLSLSRRLAELLDGAIVATSVPGEGSEFVLTLPTGPLTAAQWLSKPAPIRSHGPVQFGAREILRGRVLLAEDTPELMELIAQLLRKTGLEVIGVGNGRDLIAQAQAGAFDLVITDMRMPVVDGLTAVYRLRGEGYRAPIVALTANATEDDRRACLAVGCDDVVTKPIDRPHFFSVLRRLLPPWKPKAVYPAIRSTLVDDEPEMGDLLEKFVSNLPDKLAILNQAAHRSEWQPVVEEAHKLKGSGGEYGYPMITDIAGRLEARARDGEFDQARQALAELNNVIESIQRGARTAESAN